MATLKTIATAGPINYHDGLAYAPPAKRVFVSDEHGGVDAVIDAVTNKLVANIPLGGGAGNPVYDNGSGHILVAVHGVNELVSISRERYVKYMCYEGMVAEFSSLVRHAA